MCIGALLGSLGRHSLGRTFIWYCMMKSIGFLSEHSLTLPTGLEENRLREGAEGAFEMGRGEESRGYGLVETTN